MMPMDMNEIVVFIKIIEAGTFTAAAKALGMPKSTVSHKLSELERRLGVTLIQRTTRKLHVTAAGRAYYERARAGMETIAAAEQELASAQQGPQGTLRVTAPVELGASVLPELVKAYIRKYPAVKVDVMLTDRTVDLLGEGVDLALRAGGLPDSSMIAKRLGDARFAVYASAAYLKRRGKPSHPRELVGHNWLIFTSWSGQDLKLVKGKERQRLQMAGPVQANDLALLRGLACQGEGLALLPTFYCQAEVKRGQLVRVLPEWASESRPVHFVYPGQRFVPARLKAFMEMGAEHVRRFLDGGF